MLGLCPLLRGPLPAAFSRKGAALCQGSGGIVWVPTCLLWHPFLAGLFVSILILSLVFASRLRPASRAPLLFRPDTNIQVLLDLKYNLSAEGISCITCSGEGFQPEVPCGPLLSLRSRCQRLCA